MEALVDVNKATNNKWTPLHIAASLGRVEIMKCLMHYAALLD
jgi:ankyrin repeat protein